jgi:DNA-binding transcriptional regulator YbjK
VALLDQISGNPLNVVATAVTPVVMVSAIAILISSVNGRYVSVADRVRSLAREYREPGTTPDRRENIRLQMMVFQRRLRLVSWATRVLYAAVGCFIAVALLISGSVSRQILSGAALVTFLVGLVLTASGIVLQLLELKHANRTIDLETADVLKDARKD